MFFPSVLAQLLGVVYKCIHSVMVSARPMRFSLIKKKKLLLCIFEANICKDCLLSDHSCHWDHRRTKLALIMTRSNGNS